MKTLKFLSTVFIILLFTSSCVSKRKIKEMRDIIDEQQLVENQIYNRISSLDEMRIDKNSQGEIDDKSNVAIKKLIDREKSYVKNRTDSLNKMYKMLSGEKRIKRKDFKKIVSVISLANNEVKGVKTETVDFVENLLKQKTFIKFNSAAFFGPGGYKIPEEKMEEAKKVFSPIVDSLIVFVKKYPKIKLSSSIISSGYADGQGFGAGELVNQLTANLGKEIATKEELNSELSRLRAEEVSSILLQIYKNKLQVNNEENKFQTDFFALGKGEELPNKKINDYLTDDDRRRIVVIYWNALPKE
ncbi:MAG: hypothetical protein ACOVQ2_06065 [Flavobacterium sp.]